MTHLFRIAFFGLATIILAGCISQLESIQTDRTRSLDDDVGYLFITFNSDISLTNFEIEGPKTIRLRGPDYKNGINYFLVPVPSGKYQITKIVAHFGRYYEFNEEGDKKLWEFEVKPGTISYVGELKVRRIKYLSSTFELTNKSSFALEYLEQQYPKILALRNLEYHGPGKDFFFDLVTKRKQKIKEL